MKSISIFLKVLAQSFVLSLDELRASKLRSFLSLLGVSIGVLCIVSIRTAVGSLEINIQKSIESFGNNVLYIQKWPWIWSENYPWWRYVNRPGSNPREMKMLKQRLVNAEAVAIMYSLNGKKISADSRVANGVTLQGVSYDYNKIKSLEFKQGRYFTAAEELSSSPVAIIGYNVAETLFPGFSELTGREISVEGVRLSIIGVLKKEGNDILGFSADNDVVVPYGVLNKFINLNSRENDPLLAVLPKKGVKPREMKLEIAGAMRAIRRIPPDREDNFSVNQVSVFSEGIKSIFYVINVAGFLIGIFSIVVGGFGIANIMFVSVKERTYIIGIKKAIGAKQLYILLEFLLEAILLCVLGGIF
ncbi:MAG: ABC transporter permease, partial [Chitinophagales bacterium]|nr:ABC transporter permease [Chitinophagales bacterium]